MNDSLCMYWLATTPGMSRWRGQNLVESYSLRELWDMPGNRFASVPGITPELARAMCVSRDERILNTELEAMERKGIWLLPLGSGDYPELLSRIPDPPLILYGLGKIPSPRHPRIAIIGSRDCSEYGRSSANRLANGLASVGFIVVSGMARGIDGEAHKAAIDAFAPLPGEAYAPSSTIAVLGSGVDICYPPENINLYRRIIKNGCIISEYPPGTKTSKYYFPQRNRIISGLSLGIIVVEAAEKSGTGITVNTALDQGREVFVVPGSMFSRLSAGTNSLIKHGAVPITSHEDVLWALRRELGYGNYIKPELPLSGNESGEDEHNIVKITEREQELSADEAALYAHISDEPVDISSLIVMAGMAPQDVLYLLTKLELARFIKNCPGQRYVRTYIRN